MSVEQKHTNYNTLEKYKNEVLIGVTFYTLELKDFTILPLHCKLPYSCSNHNAKLCIHFIDFSLFSPYKTLHRFMIYTIIWKYAFILSTFYMLTLQNTKKIHGIHYNTK